MSAAARRFYVRAVESLRRGESDDARSALRAALDLCPVFSDARVAYAGLLAQAGERSQAARVIREGLPSARTPRARAMMLRSLGDALLADADYRGAEEAYRGSAESGAEAGLSQPELHDRLARLRARTGRFDEALAELLRAARG